MKRETKAAIVVPIVVALIAGGVKILSDVLSKSSEPSQYTEVRENKGNAAIVNQSHDVLINQSTGSNRTEDELTDMLVPADEPRPNSGCPDDPSGVLVVVGGLAGVVTSDARLITVLALDDRPLLWVERDPEGAYISGDFLREDGRTVATLKRNRFTVNPDNYFDNPVRPDRHELRITKHGQLALRVRFVNESTFLIEGSFLIPGHGMLTATPGILRTPWGDQWENFCVQAFDGILDICSSADFEYVALAFQAGACRELLQQKVDGFGRAGAHEEAGPRLTTPRLR